ncbi:Putative heme oxygenase 1 [Gryllus bimaculatus]|nr:Putative heme oxygenase 1 [Gryllus bimaculatus]
MSEVPFTKQMRKVTREIHAVSDAMVNAKLAFALSDNAVWAEGLLVFYEIFRYLEEAMARLKNTNVGKLDVEGMRRADAFQEDLNFYLGSEWTKQYEPRESVVKYLLHLQKCEKSDPNLLMAYIYHLYMGLLSGGQILAKKRSLNKKLFPFSSQQPCGNAVTDFGDIPISKIKKELVEAMNNVAIELDEETKQKILEESKTVFILNNEMIRSIEGTGKILIKKLLMIILLGVLIIGTYISLFHLEKYL